MPLRTLVIQSYRTTNVPDWINTCLGSVRSWSRQHAFDYRFVGDEIFDRLPDWYRHKTTGQPQIATDLGRLHLIQEALDEGFECAIWLDADVLIFDPDNFVVSQVSGFSFGREVWIQEDPKGALCAFRNVHNAYALFCADNRFLAFYQYACEQIISRMNMGPDKGMLPQIVGPKLLTSLNNTLAFELTDSIAMLSPDVLHDILQNGGPALDLLRASQKTPPHGANLCASLATEVSGGDTSAMDRICQTLLSKPKTLWSAYSPPRLI